MSKPCNEWCRGEDHDHYCPNRTQRCCRPCSICAMTPAEPLKGQQRVFVHGDGCGDDCLGCACGCHYVTEVFSGVAEVDERIPILRAKLAESEYQRDALAAEVERLRGEKRYTVEQIQAACPACDGKGGTCSTRYAHACGGDDQRCAVLCPVPEEDWEQCEYCGRVLDALAKLEVSRG